MQATCTYFQPVNGNFVRNVVRNFRFFYKLTISPLASHYVGTPINILFFHFRAGEEKEVAMEQLQVERLEFEDKMNNLHHQMTSLSKERENILEVSLHLSLE